MYFCNFLLSLFVFREASSQMFVLGSVCNPANYICSGRCPSIPPKLQLPNGVAICMKDSNTKGCVCWLDGESNHIQTWFRCEALINGTITDINCQAPVHCFPPDSDPTCLVIPYCDCRLLREDDSPAFQYGNWKPVRADVYLPETLENYSKDIREFSMKHLLFLLGFVIAPLACWCLLNFINENRCKRKNTSDNAESVPINLERRNTVDQDVVQVPPIISTSAISSSNRNHCLVRQSNFQLVRQSTFSLSCHQTVSSAPPATEFQKLENPPSYDEAINPDSDEDGPPPSYTEAVQLYVSRV